MRGDALLGGLLEIQDERGGLMSNARGRGLMIAFDLPDTETRGKAHTEELKGGGEQIGITEIP